MVSKFSIFPKPTGKSQLRCYVYIEPSERSGNFHWQPQPARDL